jgi:hypothetical protein
MGSSTSVDLSAQLINKFDYFSIRMCRNNLLCLILAPEEIVAATQSVLQANWRVKKVNKSSGFTEFELEGKPWYSVGEENLQTKYFLCSLLQKYYAFGWYLKAATDIQRYGSETNALFFHRQKPIETNVICLSLNSSDKIRILGPEALYPIVKQSIVNSWPLGIKNEQIFGLSYELKLNGYPWYKAQNDSTESFFTPNMMCNILNNLYKNGWIFINAIDSSNSEQSLNALYFMYSNEIDLNSNFFTLTLNHSDQLRFHHISNDLNTIISKNIESLWPAGIKNENLKENNTIEYTLKGNPWKSNGFEAVTSRKLINDLLNLLAYAGWNLYATCDLCKRVDSKSTFFFRSNLIKSSSNVCVSLNECNKIRLINSNYSLIQQVKNVIWQNWQPGISKESDYCGSKQFELNGNPFSSSSKENKIYVTVLMLNILNSIESNGLKLLCSADVSGKYYSDENESYSADLHSFFFQN